MSRGLSLAVLLRRAWAPFRAGAPCRAEAPVRAEPGEPRWVVLAQALALLRVGVVVLCVLLALTGHLPRTRPTSPSGASGLATGLDPDRPASRPAQP